MRVESESSATDRNNIRVWALFGLYYPNFAGAAIQGHRVFRRLVSQGFNITVLTAAKHRATSLSGEEVELDGLRIRYLPLVSGKEWNSLRKSPFLYKAVRLLNGLLSSLSLNARNALLIWRDGCQDDIVQFYSINDFSFVVIWLARYRKMHPVIRMTLLGSDSPDIHQRGIKRILAELRLEAYRRTEAVVSISSALTESCISAGLNAEKVFQIPNGVDLAKYYPLDRQKREQMRLILKLPLNRRFIVFVGAAVYRKGIDVLITSFIQVANQLEDVDLLVIGPNDFADPVRHPHRRQQLLDELTQELSDTNLTSRVHWIGEITNVQDYLQAADLFCLPTRREGLGTAIAEAMAVGLPVVTAHLDGVTTDLIKRDDEGFLISGHDPDDYAAALLKILSDTSLARHLGQSARIRAEKEFSLDLAVNRYADLYVSLVGGTC